MTKKRTVVATTPDVVLYEDADAGVFAVEWHALGGKPLSVRATFDDRDTASGYALDVAEGEIVYEFGQEDSRRMRRAGLCGHFFREHRTDQARTPHGAGDRQWRHEHDDEED